MVEAKKYGKKGGTILFFTLFWFGTFLWCFLVTKGNDDKYNYAAFIDWALILGQALN